MPSIVVKSDPVDDDRDDYTRVTLVDLQQIPWGFLSRQRNLASLTVINYTPEDMLDESTPPTKLRSISRLHLKGCSDEGVRLMLIAAPRAIYVELANSEYNVDVSDSNMRTLYIRDCPNMHTFRSHSCESLETIYVTGALPNLRLIQLWFCYRLRKLPNNFYHCEKMERIDIMQMPYLQTLRSLCDKMKDLKELSITMCPSLRELPSIHPDAAPNCEVELRQCGNVTIETIPVTWRLITDTRRIELGNDILHVNDAAFKAALQTREDKKNATWNRGIHRTSGNAVNEVISALLLGLQRLDMIPEGPVDAISSVDPELVEEAIEALKLRYIVPTTHAVKATRHHLLLSDEASDDESTNKRSHIT